MTDSIEMLVDPNDDDVSDLVDVLVDCVEGGASVNFVRPLGRDTAVAWWRAALADEHAVTWVARDVEGSIIGCVRLVLAQQPNGQHRGEVSKTLVRRRSRGRGVATDLLSALEAWAGAHGRHRLVLDTETGSDAERVYQRLGWQRVGVVPDFCRSADGRLASTTYYTKGLASG